MSIDCIPERSISAIYALEFIDNATTAVIYSDGIEPISGNFIPNVGRPKYIKYNCTNNGVPLKISIYAVDINDTILFFDILPKHINIPPTNPNINVNIDIRIVV